MPRFPPRFPLYSAKLIALLCFASPSLAGVSYPLPKIPDTMKRVESEFYLLIHDLTDAEAAEATARMDAMVREYTKRTRDFAGRIQGKMPFLLFRNEVDYLAAGAPEGTAGVFNGRQLMAVAGKRLDANTWHTIQHEGFHQFAHLVIGGELPIWVNEGMAEYFGEGVFTGDTFVAGGIPAFRLKRIQKEIKDKQFKPIREMMELSHAQWNQEMKVENYDQAWAMVQFLAHAENGKYQKPFINFMIALSRRQPWPAAWENTFGSAAGFEKVWEDWWLTRPVNATPEVYAEAATRMLANYAARAASQKQTFETADDLRKAIKDRTVKMFRGDELPAGLAKDCDSLTGAVLKMDMTFALELPAKGTSKLPLAVTCTMPDGKIIRATTPVRGVRAGAIVVTTKNPPTTKKSK